MPPALLALVTLLQAYTGASDAEAVEAAVMDRRWQLVLDCLDCADAPFSTGTLVAFRERLIAAEMDRRLIERTVEVAAQTKGFGHRQLRAALDSSPLWGAGRVEDTYNLLGHALRKAVGMLARQQGRELAAEATAAGAPLLGGASLKAALDCDWDDPAARAGALAQVLAALDGGGGARGGAGGEPRAERGPGERGRGPAGGRAGCGDASRTARWPCATGWRRSGGSAWRTPTCATGARAARQLIDGYKRHVLRDLDSQLIRAVGLTRANAPEASVTPAIVADLARQAGDADGVAHRPRLPEQHAGAGARPRA